MNWDNFMLNSLRSLWDQGVKTAEIARRLGCSKNSVVGKAHRMNLTPRPNPVGSKGTLPLAQPRKPPAPRKPTTPKPGRITISEWQHEPAPVVPKPKPEPRNAALPIPVGELRPALQCQWITSDERPWRFCSDASGKGRSYCAVHFSLSRVRV